MRTLITYGPGGSCDCVDASAGCDVNPEPHEARNVLETQQIDDPPEEP